MNIIWWLLLIIILILVGTFVIARWVIRKGHKGYTTTRDAIRDKRDKRVQNPEGTRPVGSKKHKKIQQRARQHSKKT